MNRRNFGWSIACVGFLVLVICLNQFIMDENSSFEKEAVTKEENNLIPAPEIRVISEKSEEFVQGNLSVEYWKVDGMPCVKINSLNPSFSCDWSKNTRQDLQ